MSLPLPAQSLNQALIVRSSVIGRRTKLAVFGELDMATAPELRSAVDAALSAGARDVWIDLSATEFMDSAGLHVLLETRARLAAVRGRFALICADGAVRHVLRISGVDRTLPVYADRSAAHRDA